MWRPSVEDYAAVAAQILGTTPQRVLALPQIGLAESALAAPFAGFGEHEAYQGLELKAAVLLERLARNHPLPDGNKRAAFVLTVLFLQRNGCTWHEPDVELDAGMVERVAAGLTSPGKVVEWIRDRTG